MRRLYTYGGKGISTKLKSLTDGQTYIVSTAPNASGVGWQLAVFHDEFGVSDVFKPLRITFTETFGEAEAEHTKTEEMVEQLSRSDWQNWPMSFDEDEDED